MRHVKKFPILVDLDVVGGFSETRTSMTVDEFRSRQKQACLSSCPRQLIYIMKKIILLCAAVVFSSCAGIAPPASPGTVDHCVFFWMKHPNNPVERQKIVDATNRLRVIGGIHSLDYGKAVPSDRPVVDDSFDFGLLVRFESVAALHAYEKDPRHMKEVNEVLLPLTKKVLVYDIGR
jgi:hypothetical protein